MKLGVNSVLFGGYDMATAFKYIAACGYDGIEISAIDSMSQHLVVDRWRELAPVIKQHSQAHNLPILAIEHPSQDPQKMEAVMQAAAAINCPIVNCGPGGKSNDDATLRQSIDSLGKLADMAGKYGVTLCVKAHVGAAVHNTPTTLEVLKAVNHPSFGLDMDPSHIHRAGENPVDALRAVVHRVKHVHIRDCKGRQQNPGKPEMQSNGRGDIDLLGYIRVLHENKYQGPLDLEVIGAKEYELPFCVMIAAESRGHMQACLQACGAR
ncbi:MAG: sugar phosphate isomerase/epimerase [Phycisphaeraceae bacterium]|nr:sugar phosphate isomerase/epimerase [Phycisphaeraceae bacterium]